MREYEELIRALTLREEVADGRLQSTGSAGLSGVKRNRSAGLSAPLLSVTPFPRWDTTPEHSTDWKAGS